MREDVTINFNSIYKSNSILFGPFVGELGWELFRWSGFIRWLKNKYPTKEIIVLTRKGREDLYYNIANKIYSFSIEGDYKKYQPNMYRLDKFSEREYNILLHTYTKNHPGSLVVETPLKSNNRNFFKIQIQNYNFSTHPDNKSLINKIIEKHGKNKIIISLSPRERTDITSGKVHNRNWYPGYWKSLMDMINSSNKFLGFIHGSSPTFIRPNVNSSNLFVLEDCSNHLNTTNIGLSIEAIKASSLTVGQHSAIPLLSNYMKTPTLMWGQDKTRHTVLENPYRTPCLFIDDNNFNVESEKIFSYIRRILKV
jgi:hypothetical protein